MIVVSSSAAFLETSTMNFLKSFCRVSSWIEDFKSHLFGSTASHKADFTASVTIDGTSLDSSMKLWIILVRSIVNLNLHLAAINGAAFLNYECNCLPLWIFNMQLWHPAWHGWTERSNGAFSVDSIRSCVISDIDAGFICSSSWA